MPQVSELTYSRSKINWEYQLELRVTPPNKNYLLPLLTKLTNVILTENNKSALFVADDRQ